MTKTSKKPSKYDYLSTYRRTVSHFVDDFHHVMTVFCESEYSWATIALNCGCSFEFMKQCYLGTVRVSDIPYLVFMRMKDFAQFIENTL